MNKLVLKSLAVAAGCLLVSIIFEIIAGQQYRIGNATISDAEPNGWNNLSLLTFVIALGAIIAAIKLWGKDRF